MSLTLSATFSLYHKWINLGYYRDLAVGTFLFIDFIKSCTMTKDKI